jgi:hypothetical protein
MGYCDYLPESDPALSGNHQKQTVSSTKTALPAMRRMPLFVTCRAWLSVALTLLDVCFLGYQQWRVDKKKSARRPLARQIVHSKKA